MVELSDFRHKKISFYSDINTDFTINNRPLFLENIETINNQIFNLLMTVKGSRPKEPTFGSNIPRLLHEPMNEITAYRIETAAFGAIATWMSSKIQLDIGRTLIIPNYSRQAYDSQFVYFLVGEPAEVELNIRFEKR